MISSTYPLILRQVAFSAREEAFSHVVGTGRGYACVHVLGLPSMHLLITIIVWYLSFFVAEQMQCGLCIH